MTSPKAPTKADVEAELAEALADITSLNDIIEAAYAQADTDAAYCEAEILRLHRTIQETSTHPQSRKESERFLQA